MRARLRYQVFAAAEADFKPNPLHGRTKKDPRISPRLKRFQLNTQMRQVFLQEVPASIPQRLALSSAKQLNPVLKCILW